MFDPVLSPLFIADAMLGKLARWLRLLGYDTLYSQESDSVIAECARREGRIVLTRDRGLAVRRGLRVILLTSTSLELQLAQVNAVVGIPPVTPRCMACNGFLDPVSLEKARSQIPPYVAATQSDFRQCQHCGRIFWHGTHWDGICRRIARALDPEVAHKTSFE